MELKTAVSIVDQAMQSRGVDVRKAWGIIRAELVVVQNSSHNTAITKCPNAKECFPTIDRALRNS